MHALLLHIVPIKDRPCRYCMVPLTALSLLTSRQFALAYVGCTCLRRDRQLNEREAAVALREQRVGGMDSDLLATFGDHPNGKSSASKEVGTLPCLSTTIKLFYLESRFCEGVVCPPAFCGKYIYEVEDGSVGTS